VTPSVAGRHQVIPSPLTKTVVDEQHVAISIEDHGGGTQVGSPADELVVGTAQGGD